MVDNQIVAILRQRKEACMMYEADDWKRKCKKCIEDYDNAELNWFIKCMYS